MFIGGGSAGTAGGIKVTTFALLFFVIWAEVRGDPDLDVFGRRIDHRVQRQALDGRAAVGRRRGLPRPSCWPRSPT